MPNPNEAASAPAVRRFRPRALPTLAMIAAVVVCVAAGRWQQDRMHGKEALAAQLDAATRMPPLTLDGMPDPPAWPALRYRQVAAAGEYVARGQILIDNKVHQGRAGYDVVTPLALADGRAVLVDRGWVALSASRAAPPDVPVPAGAVRVSGRISVPGEGSLQLAPDAHPGQVWQRLDPGRYGTATGIRVLPVVIEQTDAPEDGLVRDWQAPDFGIDKHRIYMVQWYAFATLALALWLGLNFRRVPAPATGPVHG